MGPIRVVLGMMVTTTSADEVTLCIDEIVPACYMYGFSEPSWTSPCGTLFPGFNGFNRCLDGITRYMKEICVVHE